MFCPNCGKAVASGAKFCAGCGAVVPGTSDAQAATAAEAGAASVTKPLSALLGVLMAVGLFILGCGLGYFGGVVGIVVVALATLGTSLWAAIDSSRIRLREYQTWLAAHPVVLFVGLCLLWAVVFPAYMVARSRVLAGVLQRREHPKRFGLVVLLPGVSFAILAFVWYAEVGSSVNGIWQQSSSQLAAAAGSSPAPLTAPVQSPLATSAPITGSYKMEGTVRNVADNGQTVEQRRVGVLDVVKESDGKAKFALKAALVRDEAKGDVNTDELEGEVEIRNSEAVYAYDHGEYAQCKITMRFAPDKVELRQEQPCEFGAGVDATGTYAKVSSDRPNLTAQQ